MNLLRKPKSPTPAPAASKRSDAFSETIEHEEPVRSEKKAPATSSGTRIMSPLLVRSIVTEKIVSHGSGHTVAFEVPEHANKPMIMHAVTQSFAVTPEAVRIVHVRGKRKRTSRGYTLTAGYKKAYVTLPAGTEVDTTTAPK